VILELNSETDFLSRSQVWDELSATVGKAALSLDAVSGPISLESLQKSLVEPTGTTLAEALLEATAKTRENIRIRRAFSINLKNNPLGIIAGHVHGSRAELGIGRFGSLVVIDSEARGNSRLIQLAKKLAINVSGFSPKYISENDIPGNVDRESAMEDVLVHHKLLTEGEGDESIGQVLQRYEKELNTTIHFREFVRCEVGEFVEGLD